MPAPASTASCLVEQGELPRRALEPLRDADEDLGFRRGAVEAEIDAGIQLQIGTHQPGGGEVEAVLPGLHDRVVVDVRPELDIERDILHELMADGGHFRSLYANRCPLRSKTL